MIVEVFYVVFVTIFIGLVVLGHALLFSAIDKRFREDTGASGRRSDRKRAIADATESTRVQNIWLFGS
jgi:hypothetical protein